MVDPGPWPKNEEIVEVRNEDPSAEVDDVVVRYQDHTIWIQIKLSMDNNGPTWVKFWKRMIAQRWGNFSENDRLVLSISQTPDWVKDLEEICGRAYGSRRSLELATLEQQVKEWEERLSGKQKALISKIVRDVSGKQKPKVESEEAPVTEEADTR